ncbi:hypothetical protein psyc5s11_39750 [Clostridium gelidum]|uniref:Uncharacterized protein n=1 Tax=Clostridium gelidum TaxID=704125 RepID=A0ABM7T9A6_9CLOT|nr:hypothetical protein psyc5s11_39750 [Clostridium gelidum]
MIKLYYNIRNININLLNKRYVKKNILEIIVLSYKEYICYGIIFIHIILYTIRRLINDKIKF